MGSIHIKSTYPCSMSTNDILFEIIDEGTEYGQENNLFYGMKWYHENNPLNSKEEAEDFLNRHHPGSAEGVAVAYLEPVNIEKQIKGHSKMEATYRKVQELRSKADSIKEDVRTSDETAVYFKDFKSKLITCKICGSKLAVPYLKNCNCPVCGQDLRSQTAINRRIAAEKRYHKLYQQASELQNKLEAKLEPTKMWLVECHFYCG